MFLHTSSLLFYVLDLKGISQDILLAFLFHSVYVIPYYFNLGPPHQWLSGNAQNWKTGGASSNPGCACRPSRSEFSVVFSETRVNTGCII